MPAGYKHGDTPKRAMVRGTISYLESQGLPVNKSAIFRHFGLSRSQGYASLSIPASKRNDPEWEETRGRPMKIGEREMAAMEAILWDERYEDVNLNWTGLAREAGVETECNARTLHRAMGTLGYRRCLSLPGMGLLGATGGVLVGGDGSGGCARSWTHKKTRERRLEYAERMLEAYPQPHNWRFVRFSGELHFGFGLDGMIRLMPKSGEKYCDNCRQHQQPEKPEMEDAGSPSAAAADATAVATSSPSATPVTGWQRDVKRLHAWVAIGFGFKSELVFYDEDTSPNNTGVMTMQDYHDKVLEAVVKPWLSPNPNIDPNINIHPVHDPNHDPNVIAAGANPDGTPLVGGIPPPHVGLPQSFILEEEVEAFAHGGASKVNQVQGWKDAHGLRYYFSCLDSPDLSPLDSLWPTGKQWQQPQALKDWDPDTLKQAAREAWEAVDQERVNVWADFMPQRLRQVLASEGRLVPW